MYPSFLEKQKRMVYFAIIDPVYVWMLYSSVPCIKIRKGTLV